MKNFKRTIALPGGSRPAARASRHLNSRFEWLAWSMADNAKSRNFLDALRTLDAAWGFAPGTREEKAFIVAYRFLANALENGKIDAGDFTEWLAVTAEHFFKFNGSNYITSSCYCIFPFNRTIINSNFFRNALRMVISVTGRNSHAAAVCHYILGKSIHLDHACGGWALDHYKKAIEILKAGEFQIGSKLWFDLHYYCAVAAAGERRIGAVGKDCSEEASGLVTGALADIDFALNEYPLLRASSGPGTAAAGWNDMTNSGRKDTNAAGRKDIAADERNAGTAAGPKDTTTAGREDRAEIRRRIRFNDLSPRIEIARLRAAEALIVYNKINFIYYDDNEQLLRGALMDLLRNIAPQDDPAPVIELYFKLFSISAMSGVGKKARKYLEEAERLIGESFAACETLINFYYAVAVVYLDEQKLTAYYETLEKLMELGAALYGDRAYYFWLFTSEGMLMSLVNGYHEKGIHFYEMRKAARADEPGRFGGEKDYIRNIAGQLYLMAGDLEKAESEFALVASGGRADAKEAMSFLKKVRAARAAREGEAAGIAEKSEAGAADQSTETKDIRSGENGVKTGGMNISGVVLEEAADMDEAEAIKRLSGYLFDEAGVERERIKAAERLMQAEDHEGCLEEAGKALERYRETGKLKNIDVSYIYYLMCVSCNELGNYAKASECGGHSIEYHQKAKKANEEDRWSFSRSDILLAAGDSARMAGDANGAKEYLKNAVEAAIHEYGMSKAQTAIFFCEYADHLYHNGWLGNAAGCFEKALEIFGRSDRGPEIFRPFFETLLQLAHTYEKMDLIERAMETLDSLVEFAEAGGAPGFEARARCERGRMKNICEDTDGAFEDLYAALRIACAGKNSAGPLVARILNEIGHTLSDAGDHAAARENYELAVRFAGACCPNGGRRGAGSAERSGIGIENDDGTDDLNDPEGGIGDEAARSFIDSGRRLLDVAGDVTGALLAFEKCFRMIETIKDRDPYEESWLNFHCGSALIRFGLRERGVGMAENGIRISEERVSKKQADRMASKLEILKKRY